MPRALATALAAACLASLPGLAGCSVLLDWSGYTGGALDASAPSDGAARLPDAGPDARADADAEAGAQPDADAQAQPAACNGSGVCAPPAPSGWNGPVALYEVPGSGTRPACPAGYVSASAFDGNGGLNAGPATCDPCTCADPKGAQCSAPVLAFWSDANCTEPCGSSTRLTTAACVPPPGACNSFTIGPSAPDGGACVPSGGGATLPPTSWSVMARACAPSDPAPGSCPGSGLCMPDPGSLPAARVCVWQTGPATPCPSGYDTAPDGPRVYYGDAVTDPRACTACSCSAPLGGSCDESPPPPSPAGFRLLTTCGTAPTIPFFVPNDCTVLTAQTFKLDVAPTLSSAGACTPSGGQPTGAASPTSPTTFCCLP